MVFYRSTCRVADAMYYAEEFISHTSDTEEKAVAYFLLGQAMEHINDFESAYRYYSQALVLEPSNSLTSRHFWENSDNDFERNAVPLHFFSVVTPPRLHLF